MRTKKLFGQFVEAVAQELEIPYKGFGQTTWKRPEVARGLEADECYYFEPEKLAAAAAAKARSPGMSPTIPTPTWGSRSTSRLQDRPAGDLCRPRGHRGLAVRR